MHELIEAGYRTKRWHTVLTIKEQNLAAHSWGVAMIISRLFSGSSEDRLRLIEAALDHDLAEGWTGDIPRPAKCLASEDIEKEKARELGLAHVNLPPELKKWLFLADTYEAYLFAQRESEMGNGVMAKMARSIWDKYFVDRRGEIPPDLAAFIYGENT